MILNEQERKEFGEAARPLMLFLSKTCHPHVTVIVDYSGAELFESMGGVWGHNTFEIPEEGEKGEKEP